uniref:Transmembrane protein putative n=1 Tax=Albugo laibachii Nc14 TaxID=890382 RepID=F0WFP7_9STRA|nr:transmembrane protein putative [Albugo laibachii Nc14]|eukprot:CCA20029.1 transmembrane protein putative [Albugo laibachii Nc14]
MSQATVDAKEQRAHVPSINASRFSVSFVDELDGCQKMRPTRSAGKIRRYMQKDMQKSFPQAQLESASTTVSEEEGKRRFSLYSKKTQSVERFPEVAESKLRIQLSEQLIQVLVHNIKSSEAIDTNASPAHDKRMDIFSDQYEKGASNSKDIYLTQELLSAYYESDDTLANNQMLDMTAGAVSRLSKLLRKDANGMLEETDLRNQALKEVFAAEPSDPFIEKDKWRCIRECFKVKIGKQSSKTHQIMIQSCILADMGREISKMECSIHLCVVISISESLASDCIHSFVISACTYECSNSPNNSSKIPDSFPATTLLGRNSLYVSGYPYTNSDNSLDLSSIQPISLPSHLYVPNRIVYVASSQYHSLFLNDFGMVLSCGSGKYGALGHNNYKSIPARLPLMIQYFIDERLTIRQVACGGDSFVGTHSLALSTTGEVFCWGAGGLTGRGRQQCYNIPGKLLFHRPNTEHVSIRSISCGSGFSVAVSNKNEAFSWGVWSDGRLGLGPIPIEKKFSSIKYSRRALSKYQLVPKYLDTSYQFSKIACGQAHCVALLTYKRKSAIATWGRGSHGQLGNGTTQNSLSPQLLSICDSGIETASWTDVAAGKDWCIILDEDGRIWSWGAMGGNEINQADTTIHDSSVQNLVKKCTDAYRKESQQGDWANDQQMESGRVALPFRWVRPHLISNFKYEKKRTHCGHRIASISAGLQHGAATSTAGDVYVWNDKMPYTLARDSMTHNKAELVFCGGHTTFVIAKGSFLAASMANLYRMSIVDTEADTEKSMVIPPDLYLLVSGRKIGAHKVVLATRSPLFRELLLQAEICGCKSELILTDVRYEVARCLMQYIYTDSVLLPTSRSMKGKNAMESAISQIARAQYLIQDLARAAQKYKLPALEAFCLSSIGLQDQPAMMQATLQADLSFAFKNSAWSDVILVTEDNQKFYFHQCILAARSLYFRNLFFSGMQENSVAVYLPQTLAVEESSIVVMRLGAFIYSEDVILESGQDEEAILLECLVAANKYGLDRLKHIYEETIQVSSTNWPRLLVVADLAHAKQLKQASLKYVRRQLLEQSKTGEFDSILRENPHIPSELYHELEMDAAHGVELQSWYDKHEAATASRADSEGGSGSLSKYVQFPLSALLGTIVLATLYITLLHQTPNLYGWVPAVNFIFSIVVLICGFRSRFDD